MALCFQWLQWGVGGASIEEDIIPLGNIFIVIQSQCFIFWVLFHTSITIMFVVDNGKTVKTKLKENNENSNNVQ